MKKFYENFKAKLKKDERGMTLVELLAVVVILAIIGLIAFVAIGKVIENSKKDAHVANALQIISAAELYEASGGDVTGDTIAIEDLDTIKADEILSPWTKEVYESPFTLKSTDSPTGDGYTFEITSGETKCSFTADKAELAKEGREICK